MAASARQSTTDVHDLRSLLDALQRRIDSDGARGALTVKDVLELVGRRAYGPLLLVIGLISISPASLIPGSTWLFATITLLIAIQLALHKSTPWMPRQALAMRLSEKKLAQFIRIARPPARVLDAVLRPRLQFLADPPAVIAIALACVLAALVTYPLGLIPIAPLAPGLAIALIGLGLTARDGLVLGLGTALIAGAVWILFMCVVR